MHAINRNDNDAVNSLVDEHGLAEALKADATTALPALKAEVKSIDQGLKQLYQSGTAVERIVLGRASLVDRLLTTLAGHFFTSADQSVALIAVGGYGRGELHPASDIDLMLLLLDEEGKIIYFYDRGFSVPALNSLREQIDSIAPELSEMSCPFRAASEACVFSRAQAVGRKEI